MKILSNTILKGNAINRQYKNYKTARNVKSLCIGTYITTGILSANQKNPIGLVGSGFLSCAYIKEAYDILKNMRKFNPEYKKITKRAKQIYSK